MRAPAFPAAASLSLLLMATVVLLLSTRPAPAAAAASWYTELTSALACPPCEGNNCDVDPQTCEYGTATNHCQRLVCRKGPGERCGGANGILGVCADPLNCRCYRCTGCAGNPLQCFGIVGANCGI